MKYFHRHKESLEVPTPNTILVTLGEKSWGGGMREKMTNFSMHLGIVLFLPMDELLWGLIIVHSENKKKKTNKLHLQYFN